MKTSGARFTRHKHKINPVREVQGFGYGASLTMAGETDLALDLLDDLLARPTDAISIALLKVDPQWVPLRDNPRYQQLLEKVFHRRNRMIGKTILHYEIIEKLPSTNSGQAAKRNRTEL